MDIDREREKGKKGNERGAAGDVEKGEKHESKVDKREGERFQQGQQRYRIHTCRSVVVG